MENKDTKPHNADRDKESSTETVTIVGSQDIGLLNAERRKGMKDKDKNWQTQTPKKLY